MNIPRHWPILLGLGLGCGSGSTPGGIQPQDGGAIPTGIEGTASRGPTRPVCRVDQPCYIPFSGGFEVWQGKQVVTRFRSDSGGHFLVHLPPGTYTIAADSSAGILIRSQTQKVTVAPTGITRVELKFDTGIR